MVLLVGAALLNSSFARLERNGLDAAAHWVVRRFDLSPETTETEGRG